MAFDAETTERTVTRDRVMRLRDFLAVLPDEKFSMKLWGSINANYSMHTCGTAACIGGWANLLFGKEHLGYLETGELLGLEIDEARALFEPAGWQSEDFTAAQAVQVLDHYLATGEIDWAVAK